MDMMRMSNHFDKELSIRYNLYSQLAGLDINYMDLCMINIYYLKYQRKTLMGIDLDIEMQMLNKVNLNILCKSLHLYNQHMKIGIVYIHLYPHKILLDMNLDILYYKDKSQESNSSMQLKNFNNFDMDYCNFGM